jgi:hypothetical protein
MHVSRVILGDEHHYILIVLLTHSRAVDPTGSHVPTVGPAWLWQIILAQSSCWENQRQQFGSGQLYTPLQMWPPMCLFCKVLLCIVKHRLSTVVMLKTKSFPQIANAVASVSWIHRILWQVKGVILYNGKNFNEFVVERSSGYVEQTDQHYPPLTVRETLDFAAWCQGTGYREGQ